MIRRELLVNASCEDVFNVVSNVEAYPEFISNTKSVKVLSRSEDVVEAEFVIKVMKEVRYTLRFHLDRPHVLSWELVTGEIMKKNRGSWRLEEKSAAQTLAIYEIEVDFGFFVPKKIVEGLTTVQLPELLKSFKDRAESK